MSDEPDVRACFFEEGLPDLMVKESVHWPSILYNISFSLPVG